MRFAQDRKRKTKHPCPGCFLRLDLCVCSFIPRLTLKTKVTLVIHRRELVRTTNTGQLALKALTNSEMRVRGEINAALDLSDLLTEKYQTLLFFPSADAVELSDEFVQKQPLPIQLVVPDGNWRQASKIQTRYPELASVTRVMIKQKNSSQLHLRKETSEFGMSTLQAIAMALGVIEGDEVKKQLLTLYEAKLKNTLRARGGF